MGPEKPTFADTSDGVRAYIKWDGMGLDVLRIIMTGTPGKWIVVGSEDGDDLDILVYVGKHTFAPDHEVIESGTIGKGL